MFIRVDARVSNRALTKNGVTPITEEENTINTDKIEFIKPDFNDGTLIYFESGAAIRVWNSYDNIKSILTNL